MTIYRIVPDRSTVWITARSSLHPVEGEATGLRGQLDVEVTDEGLDPSAPAELRLELDVDRLSSGQPVYDAELRRRVEANRYPTITGVGSRLAPAGAPGSYRVDGELTFHGVTRSVTGEVDVTVRGSDLVVEGEQTFDVRDFGITPPRLLMVRVHPDVSVRVHVEASPA